MRLFAIVVSFITLIAIGVLSVVVVKLRRELAETRADVTSLRESWREARENLDLAGRDDDSSLKHRAPVLGSTSVPRLAPAAQAPAAGSDPAGGAPSLALPEVKAEVQKIVTDQLANELQRREGVREQRDQQMRERMATELGLSQAEKERFINVFTSMQAERRALFEQERGGEKAWVDLRPQLDALRQKTDQSLRDILGDERMEKYQGLRASARGFGRAQGGPLGPGGP
jgi:hypothetical protein